MLDFYLMYTIITLYKRDTKALIDYFFRFPRVRKYSDSATKAEGKINYTWRN